MEFIVATKDSFMKARKWRNAQMGKLRTSYLLTPEMQEKFYNEVVCAPNSNVRFWEVVYNQDEQPVVMNQFLALVGFVNIQWENRLAEVSYIHTSHEKYFEQEKRIFQSLLYKGFFELNLENICGEVYKSYLFYNRRLQVIDEYAAYKTVLPSRKYYEGRYWDSCYYNINKREFEKVWNTKL